MGEPSSASVAEVTEVRDPRTLLAGWANSNDEWVRLLVSEVLANELPVDATTIEKAYLLLRQEKALDKRELPAVADLNVEARQDESAPPLTLTRIFEVRGVNALSPGAVIEPHEGLTILYGENGTGKTGYSRIFKALANSRTADTILGNIDVDASEEQTAKLEFKLGDVVQHLTWKGELGVSPFTRMSIFDSPSVTTHVDDDLEYVYTPTALALFNHITAAIQAVGRQIDTAVGALGATGSGILSRFQRGSTIYPLIEALGAFTDLGDLKSQAATGEAADQRLDALNEEVATLRANMTGTQIAALKSEQRVLMQAVAVADALLAFDQVAYNEELTKRARLAADYETLRFELFAAANLPADPEATWGAFIEAGEAYRQHLVDLNAHDVDRCLYCRQSLLDPARDLLSRYANYMEDKISADIRTSDARLVMLKHSATSIQFGELTEFIKEHKDEKEKPTYFSQVEAIEGARSVVTVAVETGKLVDIKITDVVATPKAGADAALATIGEAIHALVTQQENRTAVLGSKQTELLELKDAVELGKSWPLIETQVKSAKEAEFLETFKHSLPLLVRAVTELAKAASDQLINQSFDALFLEECEALRAPALKLRFGGNEGKAKRHKVMTGKHKPSKVLSEGEQKVLALADFIAEARLAGVSAPVIFDDPVSSLDHRRTKEVAQRIARLADDRQVVVFTHDIVFTTTLLGLFEKSKRCVYFQITDETGKGKVSRGTAPRIDSMSAIKTRINDTIRAARKLEGEAREALVHQGYSHLRSWCEVFTEEELLRGVSKRYQANIQMTTLANIKIDSLGEIIPKVTEVFFEACRYTDAHSQALVTLDVGPTLTRLEERWVELQKLKKMNDGEA
jgi:energy-coupling factor transporter ATP-binding protein EcfA2